MMEVAGGEPPAAARVEGAASRGSREEGRACTRGKRSRVRSSEHIFHPMLARRQAHVGSVYVPLVLHTGW